MDKISYLGTLICRERLKRNWSQEGLCKDICSVSYLSKIECGKAEASEEICSLLLEKLGIEYSCEKEKEAADLAKKAYEALFSGDYSFLSKLLDEENAERMRYTQRGIDIELLRRFASCDRFPIESEMEKCMDKHALALQRLLQERSEDAILLFPNAYVYYEVGVCAYSRGDYMKSTEYLQRAYELAAADGSAKLMLLCKLFLGGCCCNCLDIEGAERHYAPARRLAHALGDTQALEQMNYNLAATGIECGMFESSYEYFSALKETEMMSLHKLAICCEKTGRISEAAAALDMAGKMHCDYPPQALAEDMLSLVRFRIEDANYLKNDGYGEMLLSVFERCRQQLSMGYAIFHMPWVLEWYKATRQYKKALELMEEFPYNKQ